MKYSKTYKIIGKIDDKIKIRSVKGEPISIKEFDDIELFIHKPLKVFLSDPTLDCPITHVISEVSTGLSVGWGINKEEAVDSALENMGTCGIERAKKYIKGLLLSEAEVAP